MSRNSDSSLTVHRIVPFLADDERTPLRPLDTLYDPPTGESTDYTLLKTELDSFMRASNDARSVDYQKAAKELKLPEPRSSFDPQSSVDFNVEEEQWRSAVEQFVKSRVGTDTVEVKSQKRHALVFKPLTQLLSLTMPSDRSDERKKRTLSGWEAWKVATDGFTRIPEEAAASTA